ncbi:LacI family DNA-binding transcriptional regulator [Curtobacterium albidum]|uniref:LacI family DNA-binding transcriptional regulator n=2 Tax=Curtobacterium citreum TaxID=2036 RepID=A0A850DUA8_9MICO|nr:LacI family DNA-binding transcriptional regulator [Curtobacterium albidum]NUU29206.1 LacI family DNA-binding transcriptional regulator [Curtobacterium albidum]
MTRAPGVVDVARAAGVSHVTVSRVLNGHTSVRPETRARVEAAMAELGYRRGAVSSGRAPGMIDVARAAGVSHVTVSRVLNDHPSVRPETRARVEAAIAALGYRRNTVASALKSGRSRTIGVVLAGSELYELPKILLGIETAARDAGWWVSIASWNGGGAGDLTETVQRLADQSVEGVTVIADRPVAVEALAGLASGVPLSVIMSGDVANPRLSFVEVNQVQGALDAVQHLVDLGHTDLVHLSGPMDTYDARARVDGWRKGLVAAGLGGRVLEGDFTAASGFGLARRLLAEPTLPTGVFAGNDQMAMGVLAAFAEAGVVVPRDVSLVGFDDIAGAAFLVPALTTVRQDHVALGAGAIEVLLRLLDGGTASHRMIPADLVVRKSTAPPGRP